MPVFEDIINFIFVVSYLLFIALHPNKRQQKIRKQQELWDATLKSSICRKVLVALQRQITPRHFVFSKLIEKLILIFMISMIILILMNLQSSDKIERKTAFIIIMGGSLLLYLIPELSNTKSIIFRDYSLSIVNYIPKMSAKNLPLTTRS